MPQALQNPQRQTILGRDLGPYTPDIDPRKSDKPQIITGTNFSDGIDGPVSRFSTEFANLNIFDANTKLQVNELPIDNDILYGTPTGVYRFDPNSLVAYNILPVNITKQYWPWTIAKVGSFFYIAQYDIGLWQYDPINLTMTQINTPSGNQIRYVAASYGRLIYFDSIVVAQSALDDGTNFIPNLATAAGAQSLQLVGGTPYSIVSIPDGFLVYMSSGVMKATYTTQAYVFAYSMLSKGIQLFSPNASVYCPLFGAITLDNNGFFLTREYNYTTYGYPQPWESVMSDYIKKNIIKNMDFTKLGCIGMFYSKALQMLFFYFASNVSQGLFTTTLNYDCISKKWGSFDQPHYGIFEVYNYSTATYTCSYMDTYGYMQAFSETNFSEFYPDDNTGLNDYIYRPQLSDRQIQLTTSLTLNGGNPFYECFSEIKFLDRSPTAYNAYSATALYQLNAETYSDTQFGLGDFTFNPAQNPMIIGSNINDDYSGLEYKIAIPYIINEIGLNASITIGPIRFNDEQGWAEETSCIESILIGMQSSNTIFVYIDWNAISGAQDWNILSGMVDWGFGTITLNSYETILRDSNDGFTQPYWGDEELDVFLDNGSSQLFKPSGVSSIYHTLQISAENVGDMFSLKVIDVTAQLTGVEQGI